MGALPRAHRAVYLLGPRTTQLRTVPAPRPAEGELLVRIEAAATCGTDLKVWQRGGHPRMLQVPGPFGHEMAGTVVGLGEPSNGWTEGERVVVANSAPCGTCAACRSGRENLCSGLAYLNGAYGEYLLVPRRFAERSTYAVPSGLDLALAALAEPLACVLHGIGVCHFSGRETVAVIGGGPIGLMFAAVLGAGGHDVVLTDPNARRLAVARRLGAVDAFEASRDGRDAVRLSEAFGATGPEIVIEATGAPGAWETALAAVAPGGQVLLFGGCAPGTVAACDTHKLHYSEITVRGAYHHTPAALRGAIAFLADGVPDLSILLDAVYPLEKVQDALAAMEARRILKATIRPQPR
ncbi:MAG: alcohol dehydrogenase catalytic domain-containing protein [Acidobacteria bacterium]|nr:alcohol dehydrogenase catalytic domain-containing protein [Acidobacteriota bacterium]